MRGGRSGYLSLEENEEPEEEVRSNTISNIETVIHLVKGNIGKYNITARRLVIIFSALCSLQVSEC